MSNCHRTLHWGVWFLVSMDHSSNTWKLIVWIPSTQMLAKSGTKAVDTCPLCRYGHMLRVGMVHCRIADICPLCRYGHMLRVGMVHYRSCGHLSSLQIWTRAACWDGPLQRLLISLFCLITITVHIPGQLFPSVISCRLSPVYIIHPHLCLGRMESPSKVGFGIQVRHYSLNTETISLNFLILYECGTWSLTYTKEHTLQVSETECTESIWA